MFTYGRFFICLTVLITLFVIAWQTNLDLESFLQEKNLAWLSDMNRSEATSSDTLPKRDSIEAGAGPWSQREKASATQDFSQIAISDPEADSMAKLPPAGDLLNTDYSESSNSFSFNRDDPMAAGPLSQSNIPRAFPKNDTETAGSGEAANQDSITQRWKREMKLNQPDRESGFPSVPSIDPPALVGATVRDHAAIPSPPKTDPEVDRKQGDPESSVVGGSQPSPSSVRKNEYAGQLRIVQRGDGADSKRPIGYVKHTWKSTDSLPELAETYLGSRNRYMEIVRMNSKAIDDPAQIHEGTVLKIPVY